MRKRVLAILLSGLLALPTTSMLWAEELTGGDEASYVETSADQDLLIGGEAETDVPDIEIPAVDDTEEAIAEDLEDDGLPTAALAENDEAGTKPELVSEEEDLLTSEELAGGDAENISEDLLNQMIAEYEQIAAENAPVPEELAYVGDSSTKAQAHTALYNFMKSGWTQDSDNYCTWISDYSQYLYLSHLGQSSDSKRFQQIWYAPGVTNDYTNNAAFEFRDRLQYSSLDSNIWLYVPTNMPGSVVFQYNLYDDDGYTVGRASYTMTSPSTYKGTEALSFNVTAANYGVSTTQIRDLASSSVKAAFTLWNQMVRRANESMNSLGFYQWNKTTPSVTSLATPQIQTCYNSVKGGDVRWKAVANAAGYYIYADRQADGGNKLIGTVYDGNATQYFDTRIATGCWGRVYAYSVVAFNGSVKSKASAKFTLQRLAPVNITKLASASNTSVNVAWACTSTNKSNGYQIQYATSQSDLSNRTGSFKTNNVSGRSNMSRTITGLTYGKTYYFRVRAYVNYTHSVTGVKTQTWSQYSDVMQVTPGASSSVRYRALLIGNGTGYPGTNNDLYGPTNDVKAMGGTLKNNYGYTVTTKENVPSYSFDSAISSAFSGATSNDISLFYYSGHGETQSGGLWGTDTSTYSIARLATALNKVPGKIVVMLDSCGSGGAIRAKDANGNEVELDGDGFTQMVIDTFAAMDPGLVVSDGVLSDGSTTDKLGELKTSKFIVLTASGYNQTSADQNINGTWGGKMTRNVVAAAGCSFPYGYYQGSIPCDTNGNKKISLKEMYTYVQARYTQVKCYPVGSNAEFMIKR